MTLQDFPWLLLAGGILMTVIGLLHFTHSPLLVKKQYRELQCVHSYLTRAAVLYTLVGIAAIISYVFVKFQLFESRKFSMIFVGAVLVLFILVAANNRMFTHMAENEIYLAEKKSRK